MTPHAPIAHRLLAFVCSCFGGLVLMGAELPPGPSPSVPSGGKAPGDYPNFTVTGANWTMDASAVPDINGGLKNEIRMNLAGQGPLPWSLTEFGQGRYAPRLNVADPQAAASNLDALPFDLIIDGSAYQWENDLDPWAANGAAWRPHPAKGVLLASVRKNGQEWSDGAPRFHGVVSTPILESGGEGYSLIDGSFAAGDVELSIGKAGLNLGGAIDTSIAWFPYDQGWIGGHVASADFEEGEWFQDEFRHPDLPVDPAQLITWSREFGVIVPPVTLRLPDVNARTDGMLFTMSIERASTSNHITVTEPHTDGSGWEIMIRFDHETDPSFAAESGLAFSFLYVPYASGNLIGGHIRGSDANVINGRGNYAIKRISTGRYELEIPNKKATDGMLILNAAGRTGGPTSPLNRTFLSYEPAGENQFIIESRIQQSDTEQPLEDSDFYFAWVDFARPLSPPGFETIIDPPVIQEQPQSASIELGADARFTASATGSEPFIYQWTHNNSPIDGATEPSYSITNAKLEDAGNYAIEITNGGGKATSSGAVLKVLAPPAITSHPVSQDVATGDSIELSVTATGTAPLIYQWQKNGVDIPGATSAQLSLANISLADAGQYRASVSNEVKQVFSLTGRLTVQATLTPPNIIQQPQSQETTVGETATFSISAGGTPPLSYQWRHNNDVIEGAGSEILSINNSQLDDTGIYTVVVTNNAGEATSANATLTVVEAPPVILAPVILQQPQSLTVEANNPARFEVVAEGINIQYQWSRNGQVLSGATDSSLVIGSTSNSDSGDYRVTLSNQGGTTTSNIALLTVNEPNPPVGDLTIVTAPLSQTVAPGADVTFSVIAESPASLTYQWQLGNFNIPGARNQTFSIANVQQIDEGNYRVVVSDGTTSITSEFAILTVSTAPVISTHPESQVITEGDEVTFSVTATGSSALSYQWRYNGSNIPGARSQQFSVAGVQKADEGEYQVLVSDNGGSTVSNAAILTTVPKTESPMLSLTDISLSGNSLVIKWEGGPGIVLQAKASLNDPNWQDVPGTEGASETQQLALGLSAYFRLIQR